MNDGIKVLCLIMMVGGCAKQISEAPQPQPPASPASSDSAELDRIDVTGSRLSDADIERYESKPRRIPRFGDDESAAYEEHEVLYWNHHNSYQIFRDYGVNPTILTRAKQDSTFALDVDDGSYKLALAMLERGSMPVPDGIRVEEFVNAQRYRYRAGDDLFSLSAEATPSPFRQGYHVLHLGIQAQLMQSQERLPANLVFVADVSGSMAHDNKIELLKEAFTTLVSQLNEDDQIALVAYDNSARLVLPPMNADHKREMVQAINRLQPTGGTNLGHGIELAYTIAESMFQPGFINRVILTSDGVANAGYTGVDSILKQIEKQRKRGVFLTTVGVGVNVYNDHLLEQLADRGDGQYMFMADSQDIQLAFVDELRSQLQVVAKNVKSQVIFNPDVVSHYRLLGYENRGLEKEDFLDASKDGGELGAGHRVTAIYEVKLKNNFPNDELGTFSVAYQKPQGRRVRTVNKDIPASIVRNSMRASSPDMRLSISAAAFAEKLRLSYWSSRYAYRDILNVLDSLPHAYLQDEQIQRLHTAVLYASQYDSRANPYEATDVLFDLDHVPLLK